MAYTIVIKKSALKEIEALPGKIAVSVSTAIDPLAEVPRPDNCKQLSDSSC